MTTILIGLKFSPAFLCCGNHYLWEVEWTFPFFSGSSRSNRDPKSMQTFPRRNLLRNFCDKEKSLRPWTRITRRIFALWPNGFLSTGTAGGESLNNNSSSGSGDVLYTIINKSLRTFTRSQFKSKPFKWAPSNLISINASRGSIPFRGNKSF